MGVVSAAAARASWPPCRPRWRCRWIPEGAGPSDPSIDQWTDSSSPQHRHTARKLTAAAEGVAARPRGPWRSPIGPGHDRETTGLRRARSKLGSTISRMGRGNSDLEAVSGEAELDRAGDALHQADHRERREGPGGLIASSGPWRFT